MQPWILHLFSLQNVKTGQNLVMDPPGIRKFEAEPAMTIAAHKTEERN
jgi:hypothetical protein